MSEHEEPTGIIGELREIGHEHPGKEEAEIRRRLPKWSKTYLVPVLVREATFGSRELQKGLERKTWGEIFQRHEARSSVSVPLTAENSSLVAFRSMYGQPIRVGNGDQPLVEDATADQWELRRKMLVSNRQAIDEDIAICDEAIRLLGKYGVETLGAIKETG